MSRKALTATVVAATIAWSIGLSALLAPLTVRAAASGSLVKASLPAVYYVGGDGKRYVFPNEKTYKTWYADFSTVMTITDAELAAMPIGGNATYKPGVRMVKITTDPKVYAVAKGGSLRWVSTEALAVSLYGASWNQMIDDVPDAYFTNYTVGTDITSANSYSPAGEASAATSINADKNLATTSTSTTLSASLSAGQPAGGSLPKGANNVNVLKLDVRNGGSTAMTVDSLTAHRSGTGVVSDITNAYVYAGNDRLTTGRSFNSTTHDASFSGLNLTLGAGETKTLWLGLDFSTTAASSNAHSFSVTDLKSGNSIAAGLPLSGPTFTISGATAGSVTVAKSGSITNPKAGQTSAKIGEFQLNAGAAEDLNFSKIALYQGGSLSREKFSNFVLKQAGATLATVSALNSKDLAVFAAATPILIEKGNTKTFEVYADIAGSSRSAETVKLYLDQTTDLLAIGATYGSGVSVTNPTYDGGTCTSAAGDCSYSTVEAGQLTITFNGPAAKDVASNGKDVELFNFTMAAASNLEVRKLQLVLDGNGDLDDGALTSPRITDIKVVDTATGATVSGPKDSTAGTGPYAVGANTSTLDFTEVFNLTSGQARTFKVTADVANSTTLTGGEDLTTVKVTLKKFSALSAAIRNLDTSQDLAAADYVPDADVAGNTHNLKNPSLTYSLASTPVSQTYIQGVQGAQMFGLNLKAGDASDVKVNTVKLTAYVDNAPTGAFTKGSDGTATASDMILTGSLWNGSTQVGSTKSPSSGTGGEMTFDNLNLTILKGQTTSLTLKTNVAASIASLVASADRIKFDVGNRTEVNADAGGNDDGTCAAGESCTTTDITATDPDGNAITPKTTGLLNSTTVDTGTVMTLKSAGTVTVSLASDDTESEAGLLIGGASNAVLAKFRLTATDEELKLTKARMVVAGPTAVTSVSLYDGATLVGGPVSVESNGNADFSSMTFTIPKDGSKTLTVKGNLNTVGASGAASGTLATTTFDNAGSTQFEVRGTSAGSSTLITTVGTDTAGRAKVLRKTRPTISLVSLPTTTLTSGEVVGMRLTVTADAAEQVSLKKLTVAMSVTAAPSVAVSAASSIRRVGDSTNLPGASAVAGAGCAAATAGACTLTASFTNEEVIAAGTSKTYDVRLTIGGTLVTGDSVSSKLDNEPAVVVETGYITSNAAPAFEIDTTNDTTDNGTARVFIWSDNSASPHLDPGAPVDGTAAFTTVSADWTNGSYLKVLPTDTQTLTK